MLLKVVMVLLILSLGKSFLENRTAVPLSKGPWQTGSILNINDFNSFNDSSHFDDFMDQEQLRLSNPYETPGVDVVVDHDYHGMGNGID